jgi:DNA repair protein RecO (recombination protein O)
LESRLAKTDAIVLTSTSFGEGHKIVRFLTASMGKIDASAFGVRKTKSRFGSTLEPFSHTRLLLYRKSEESLYTIRDTEAIYHNEGIREDLDKFLIGSAMLEPVVRFVETESDERGLFDLLSSCMRTLNGIQKEKAIYLLCMYEVRFLAETGYRQQTEKCTVCGTAVTPEAVFADSRQGFPLCLSCRTALSVKVSPSTCKFVQWAGRSPLAEAGRVTMKADTLANLRQLIKQLYVHFFARPLTSWEQLDNGIVP